MYPPPSAAPAPQSTPAPAAVPSTPPAGGSGGVGAPAGGGGSPAGQPAHLPTQTLSERLNLAQQALDAQQAQAAQNPASDPVAVAQGVAAPAQFIGGQPQPGQQPPAQPAGPQPAESPEVAAMRQQLAATTAQMQRMQQEAATLQNWAAYGYQQHQAARQGQQPAAPGQPAAAPAQSITGVPEFDHSLLHFIGQDDAGNPTLKPGAPPDLLHRYEAYRRGTEQFFRRFATDPMSVLGEPIQRMIRQEAAALTQQTVQAHSAQQHLQGYVQANEHIFFQPDPRTGRPMVDGYGQRVLTDVGRMFVETANQLEASGVRDPIAQQRMTESIVLGRLALQRLQSGQPLTPAQQTQAVQQVQQAQAAVAQPAAQPQPFQQAQPLSVLAGQVRQQFVQQQGQAVQQYPGGPATPPSVPPVSGPVAYPSGHGRGLMGMLAERAPSFGINMQAQ
jgi:hypothetical protein